MSDEQRSEAGCPAGNMSANFGSRTLGAADAIAAVSGVAHVVLLDHHHSRRLHAMTMQTLDSPSFVRVLAGTLALQAQTAEARPALRRAHPAGGDEADDPVGADDEEDEDDDADEEDEDDDDEDDEDEDDEDEDDEDEDDEDDDEDDEADGGDEGEAP
jgi:hypothetical protein